MWPFTNGRFDDPVPKQCTTNWKRWGPAKIITHIVEVGIKQYIQIEIILFTFHTYHLFNTIVKSFLF